MDLLTSTCHIFPFSHPLYIFLLITSAATPHERSRLIVNPVMDPPTKKTVDLKVVLMISAVVVSFLLLCLSSNNTIGQILTNSSSFYSSNPTASQLPQVEEDDLVSSSIRFFI
uniref:Transmembrane protein n=1 Tax=Opuntia streptacantha TaxID=393608 RepID=A0A7C8YVR1_OPUST